MKHKLQQAMKERDDNKPLHDIILMDDACRGGRKCDGKRGRGAAGSAVLEVSSAGNPLSLELRHLCGFSKEEISSLVSKHLAPGSLVASDGLNCFPGVKEAECSHEPVTMSGNKECDEFKVFKWINTMIGNVKNAFMEHTLR